MAFPSSEFAIDKLPALIKGEVIDKLLAGTPSRAVSQYLAEHGYKVSHNAVCAYRRDPLRKALATAAKLQRLDGIRQNGQSQVELAKEVTQNAPLANALNAKLKRKYSLYEQVIPQLIEKEKFNEAATWDANETKAMRFDAELSGLLQQNPVNVAVQVVVGHSALQCDPSVSQSADDDDLIDLGPRR